MKNFKCLFFGHISHEAIGTFATWEFHGYEIAKFKLCLRCKNYFIYTLPEAREIKENEKSR